MPTETARMNRNLKVAIVHYWLDNYRGGEKVVEAFCGMFQQADIFTHIYVPEKIPETISKHKITTTFISKLPFAKTKSRTYLPLMPAALEKLDLSGYDLILSSESGPAKGVITDPESLHICYCHSPMRYIWDMQGEYIANKGKITSFLWTWISNYLRIWDISSSARVDYFIANSSFIAKRIKKFYRRDAAVIHPPVDVEGFTADNNRTDRYLAVSELIPYKKIDIIVDAFTKLKLPLDVVGSGPMLNQLKHSAGDNIKFHGRVTDEELKKYMGNCRAYVYAAKEDFGIVLAEAQSAGAPVIAYGKGGVLDIVEDRKTGVFFDEQNSESLIKAVEYFENNRNSLLPSELISKRAERFSKEHFIKNINNFISERL